MSYQTPLSPFTTYVYLVSFSIFLILLHIGFFLPHLEEETMHANSLTLHPIAISKVIDDLC